MRNLGDRCLRSTSSSMAIALYLFIFLHYFTLSTAADYTPTENFAISCGDAGDLLAPSGRIWTGDIGSKFSPLEKDTASEQPNSSSSSIDGVPYSRARLSRNEFTYSFPLITSGQKYIRLHFYPSSYGEFNRSKAFFSVKAKVGGVYTLLSNFSAAEGLNKETIVKEFCINFTGEGEKLNVTFTPTAGSDAYAFINGIEIVSMPDNLYSLHDEAYFFIGQPNSVFIGTDYAMENVYRLNVGGPSLSPTEDTGMFRTWVEDDYYFVKLPFVAANTSADLKFTQISNYTAPVEVYQTARTMGNNKTENMKYNLTWVLPVDSGFTYLLRLHFCEFQPEIQEMHNREFSILIANQTVERDFDVIGSSGGNGVPIYRDYQVTMTNQGSNQKQNIYIQLHAKPDNRTVYSDAILNGIELFKLSHPDQDQGAFRLDSSPPNESNTMTRVAITGAVVCSVMAVSILYFFVRNQMEKRKSGHLGRASKSTNRTHRPSLYSNQLCRHFSLEEIKKATNNFDKRYILGEGGFGNVYKGRLVDGGRGSTTITRMIAIKRLNPDSQQGAHEFMTEIRMLSQLRYIHLVSLIGYCNHNSEMILVYEYMANGNLRDHLYNSDNPPLRWTQRLRICIGAARGLHYLHSGMKKPIIHRDVKTTNILLDHKWVAKVSDFGLSKMSPTSVANAHISTVVKGSFGYLDPEYFRFQRLNEKSDVYSFGVVLFEVLCARPPVNQQTKEEEQVGLAHWAVSCYKDGKLGEIIDPHLKGEIAPMCLEKYAQIAMSCVLDQRIKRPSMADVVRGLELSLELQEEAEKGITLDHEEEILSQIFDDEHKYVFYNGGRDVRDSEAEASRITIWSNNEKFSAS